MLSDHYLGQMISVSMVNRLFNVVVPSLPGFGFSALFERPESMFLKLEYMGRAYDRAVGYQKFCAFGGIGVH